MCSQPGHVAAEKERAEIRIAAFDEKKETRGKGEYKRGMRYLFLYSLSLSPSSCSRFSFSQAHKETENIEYITNAYGVIS